MSSTRNAVQDDDMALDLAGLLRAIGSALRWLLPLVFVVAASVFLVLQFVPSKYKGEARVLIESKDSDYPGTTRGVEEERAVLDNEGVASQVQLLKSADLARRVAKRLDLASIAEFEADNGSGIVSDALVMLGISRDPARISPEERVLKVFYENLDIYRLEGSRVIAVDFSAQDPELAAAVANTILDEYISLQSSAKRKTTEFATTSLEPQIESLKAEVQAARKAVEDFRAHADLLMGTDNLTLNQQQLAQISSSYSQAQADKAESQAKADLIRELLKSGGSLETASDVLDSLLIQRLRERQVAIQSNIAELSITLLPNHPQLKALQSQLADYNRLIREEARKVLVGLENDAKVANQQAEALKGRLGELKVAAAQTNSDQVRLAELEREANAKARQLDQLIGSFRDADTRLRAQALPADARIISRAAVPIEPYAPKVIAITIIAALATFVIGCAFVIMREFLSGNVLYPVAYDSTMLRQPQEPTPPDGGGHYGTWPSAASAQGVAMSASFSYGDEKQAAARYVQELAADARHAEAEPEQAPQPAVAAEPEEKAVNETNRKTLLERAVDLAKPAGRAREDKRDSQPNRSDQQYERVSKIDAALAAAAEDSPAPLDVEGVIVVLSVDDPAVSHNRAFEMARAAAEEGAGVLLLEVFPEIETLEAAEGFSDLVAGDVVFSKVVYRDAGSPAHIIEAGTQQIADQMANGERFQMAVDAMADTYDAVVIDLGAIDGSLASANLLRRADRVLLMSGDASYDHELKSAARLLARNTGAAVEVIAQGNQKRQGSGWAA
ncbi:exopolysaccharide transport family protein [Labrenzia sp. CE80]|uniref:exopolysaccharide transport family protein n=1 Tax=Labrenzia sp. CE80 TaxID=1788986 RepID=UPI00129A556C|nr:exopolysaccharide transport family protein [Labrenzia sp. CE80]